MSDPTRWVTWSCKIGMRNLQGLPSGSDNPLRSAVENAFFELTVTHAEYCLSGWGATLDYCERAVFLDLDSPDKLTAEQRCDPSELDLLKSKLKAVEHIAREHLNDHHPQRRPRHRLDHKALAEQVLKALGEGVI